MIILCVSADMTHWSYNHWSASTAQRKSSVCSVVNILLLAQRWVILNNKTLCVCERSRLLNLFCFLRSRQHQHTVSRNTLYFSPFITCIKGRNMSEFMFSACPAVCWSLTRSNKQQMQILRTFINTGASLNHSWSQMCVCLCVTSVWLHLSESVTQTQLPRSLSSSETLTCGLSHTAALSEQEAALDLDPAVTQVYNQLWLNSESGCRNDLSSSPGPSRVCAGGTDLKLVFKTCRNHQTASKILMVHE